MKKSYTIKDLIFLFLGHIWWIICAAVVGAAGTFLVSSYVIPQQFQSNISMYVKNSEKQNQEQQGINNNDLTVSKSLVSTYIFILNNDAEFSILKVMLVTVGGTVLGLIFTSLIRKHFVVEADMPYAMGQAAAEVVVVGDEGGKQTGALFDFTRLLLPLGEPVSGPPCGTGLPPSPP